MPPEPAQRHPAPLATELGRCDVTQAAGKICQGSAKSTAVSHLCSSMTSQTSGDTPPPTFPGPALRILPEARGESVRSRTIGCADPERLSGPRVRESARQPRSGISRLRMLSRLVGFQSTKGCWPRPHCPAPPTASTTAQALRAGAEGTRRQHRKPWSLRSGGGTGRSLRACVPLSGVTNTEYHWPRGLILLSVFMSIRDTNVEGGSSGLMRARDRWSPYGASNPTLPWSVGGPWDSSREGWCGPPQPQIQCGPSLFEQGFRGRGLGLQSSGALGRTGLVTRPAALPFSPAFWDAARTRLVVGPTFHMFQMKNSLWT